MGTAFQGLFRNPVVSPDLLGASSGASFGAALAILLGPSGPLVQALSFATGLVAVLLVATLAALVDRRTSGIVTMILCGMLVSSVFNAAVSLIKFVADTDTKLPAITYWLMGSLAGTRVDGLSTIWVFAPACLLLYALELEAQRPGHGRRGGAHARGQRPPVPVAHYRLRHPADLDLGVGQR